MASNRTITVQGHEISLISQGSEDYISLTDMARGFEGEAGEYIRNWLRTGPTVLFLGTWEKVNNPDFNLVSYHQIKSEVIDNRFIMSVKKWLEMTNAIGLEARAGRYGGTYAHNEIALQFATWLSPEFHVYVMKEFKRLKQEESERLNTGWNLNRQLAKTNWHIHTHAVRAHLVPMIEWHTKREAIQQASEADLLNLAVFGMTAKEWQKSNPDKKGNIRDHAAAEQLLILANLQSLNAKLLEWDSPKDQRLEILHKTAQEQMDIILGTVALSDTKKIG